MSESCHILVTEWEGGQAVAGEILLEDGRLSFSAERGYEVLMENVMQGRIFAGERVSDRIKDPKAWLRSLPSFYNGGILRAQLGKVPSSQRKDRKLEPAGNP